jgi:hypothetical protein
MKSESIGWKLPVFIGALLIVALLINIFFYNKGVERREAQAQEQRDFAAAAEAKKTEEARQQTAKEQEAKRIRDESNAMAQAEQAHKNAVDDAIAEHNRLVARYLNSNFPRKPGVATMGIAIESEQGTINPGIADALAQRFTGGDIQLLNSFFKPEFVADKYVNSIFSGDTKIFDQLDLTNWVSGVVIGRQSITYSTNTALDNTITANMRLEVMALPVGAARQSHSWAQSVKGVGFNNSDAREQAEQQLLHQIASDSTMSLTNFSANN